MLMRKLKVLAKRVRHPEDARRIADAMLAAGYEVTLYDAEWMWGEYSESFAASFLGLPDDDAEIVELLRPYFEVED